MRRPRTKLQVSTFPFLAVLLCAMGSLLLLLFMMDRRAKIAAQHQVNALHAERKKRTQEEEETRNAEWENAKERLRQTLLDQQGQLDSDAKLLHGQLDDTSKKLVLIQSRHNELAQQVKSETAKIGAIQLQIASQHTELNDTAQKETASKKELIDATKELADLELAFQALRALKARETPVYSLVPYRGKRGDGRPPIYVECVRTGVLFHPERKLLDGLDFTPNSIRAEVERHAGPLVSAKAAKDKTRSPAEDKAGPYVLFLIRPDGIASYYKAAATLAGFELDFGYELVDQDWALDFNGDPNAKPARPVQIAWPKDAPKSPGGIAPLPALVGFPLGSTPPSSDLRNPSGSMPHSFGGIPSGGTPTSGTPGPPPVIGTNSYNNAGPGPAFVPTSRMTPPVPIASTGDVGKPLIPPIPGSNVGPPNSPGVGPSNAPIPGNNNPINAPMPGNSGTSNAPMPGNSNPSNAPMPGNSGTSNAPMPGNSSAGQRPSNGAPSDQGPLDAGAKMFPPIDPAPVRKTSTPVRLFGDRDFVITIDCHADYVTVSPGGTPFRWSAGNTPSLDQTFAQSIANLIHKRQASVRPGEPPYRPVIRFHVSSTGLRSYYHAYPLLVPLNVPMTRENVEN